ncbi:MAG: hypothetical protein AAFU79_30385 [Myxococcota bacterium]
MSSAPDRSAVQAFFDYSRRVEPDPREDRSLYAYALAASLVVGFLAYLAARLTLSISILVGVIAALVLCGFAYYALAWTWRSRSEQRKAELWQLGSVTRLVQEQDVARALRRVFQRTRLRSSELRSFAQPYMLGLEARLFSEEELEEILGELFSRSVRLYSLVDGERNPRVRSLGRDAGAAELVFNPLRIVCLFVTREQLIICDVEVDSLRGELHERIDRLRLRDIVGLRFSAQRSPRSVSKADMVRQARELDVEVPSDDPADAVAAASRVDRSFDETRATLEIVAAGGGRFSFPIQSELHLEGREGPLRRDGQLTDEERLIDDMLHELQGIIKEAEGRGAAEAPLVMPSDLPFLN